MGVDIHGWVEIRRMQGTWDGVLKIDSLAERRSDLFGCLFGVSNRGKFLPVAGARGFPTDLSEEATRELVDWEAEWGQEPLWPTWITWQEIQDIDLGKLPTVQEMLSVSKGWKLVFDFTGSLAHSYTDAALRLVVWFDA